MTYARDTNIGKPGVDKKVEVKNFSEVIDALEAVETKVDTMIDEQQKIVLGLSITTGTDLDKED